MIYVFTHDSIGLGEDGPTHQPIEQLASMRSIPNLIVLRPADPTEVVEGVARRAHASDRAGRVGAHASEAPVIDRTKYPPARLPAAGRLRGRRCAGGTPAVILMGSGSEVELAMGAYEKLTAEGIKARGGERAVNGAVRPAAAGVPRDSVLPRRCVLASRSRRRLRSPGIGGWVIAVSWWESNDSVRRHRPRGSTRSSA